MLGGLIIYHSLTLGQKIWSLKKIGIFLVNQWKVDNYTGCYKKNIVQHPVHFWPFVKAPAEKLMPHPQISFKSWLNNVDSDLYIFLLNSKLWWLEKVNFQTAWASPEPWTKFIFWQQAHFRPFLKLIEERLTPHSQFSFKSWFYNADSEFKKNL